MSTAASTTRPALDSVAEGSLKAGLPLVRDRRHRPVGIPLSNLVAFYGPSTFTRELPVMDEEHLPPEVVCRWRYRRQSGLRGGSRPGWPAAQSFAPRLAQRIFQLTSLQIRKRATRTFHSLDRAVVPLATSDSRYPLAVAGLYMVLGDGGHPKGIHGLVIYQTPSPSNACRAPCVCLRGGALAWRALRECARTFAGPSPSGRCRTFLVATRATLVRRASAGLRLDHRCQPGGRWSQVGRR
jgi:hypothetical protein